MLQALNLQRVLLSFGVIVFVGALVAGATGAFFSDTETSTGNTFAAGAIDLGIDNTSYYNGVATSSTSWNLTFDLDNGCTAPNPAFDPNNPGETLPTVPAPCLFFNFFDLKPGDYGEDTISLHVTNNEAWLCADVTLTEDDDETCTEPENDLAGGENGACNDPDSDPTDGDLANDIRFLWWADDGDNVLEVGERTLAGGPLGFLNVGQTAHVELADASFNIWTGQPNSPVLTDDPNEILYIGKAWCFGAISAAPLLQSSVFPLVRATTTPAQDGDLTNPPGQPSDGGYLCDGVAVDNKAQTDKAMLNVAFRAEQARHNTSFQCPAGITSAPQCSDGVDNADPEDVLIDAADPGCWTTPAEPASYDPTDNDETN